MSNDLPSENALVDEKVLDGWVLVEEEGRGRNGVVYKAEKMVTQDVTNRAACKLMPKRNLRPGWEKEIEKCARLYEHQNVVNFKEYGEIEINSEPYVCYVTEYVDGPNLKEYIDENEGHITLSFIESVLIEILEVMYAMERIGISHDDLHTSNILLSKSELIRREHPTVKVADFGIGGSWNSLKPKDDYAQLGDIALDLLQTLDKEELDSSDRFYYEFLVEDFIDKRVLETDPTQGDFVRSPENLLETLEEGRSIARERLDRERNIELEDPFDYLSCEQMGDSFELIQRLYSQNFPGYGQIRSKTNTILTGPRGCGKTTILKNMALETKLESENINSLDELKFVGVYYPCRDLYFAFHYLDDDISPEDRELLIHYFSLSLLKGFIETLQQLRDGLNASIPREALLDFEDNLSDWFTDYSPPPEGADLLQHMDSIINKEKNRVGTALRGRPRHLQEPETTLPVDFLAPQCRELINSTDWGRQIPIFFLIDDFSLPTISKGMQSTLNDLIMERWEQVYFKVATESITSFHPYKSSGKLVEEAREFESVDLAAHFIGEKDKREEFLKDVINTRLDNTARLRDKYKDISELLGDNPYASYNELARQIRSSEQVNYAGFETIRDLFSGDLSEILRLIRGMFEDVSGYDEEWADGTVDIPIPENVQDRVIRQHGGRFLNKIESVPRKGPHLRRIAETFGEEAHNLLMTEDSKNETGNPPKQAFRIEIHDSFTFEPSQHFAKVALQIRKNGGDGVSQEELVEKAQSTYKNLLRYGVFLLDVRGKSIRGGVVPRLYLRRLLLPTFRLTPSQRDNIGMEPSEFLYLLIDPDGFEAGVFDRPQDKSILDYNDDKEGEDEDDSAEGE